jgi:hypothetical protein
VRALTKPRVIGAYTYREDIVVLASNSSICRRFLELNHAESRSTYRIPSSDVSFVTIGTASKIGHFGTFSKAIALGKSRKIKRFSSVSDCRETHVRRKHSTVARRFRATESRKTRFRAVVLSRTSTKKKHQDRPNRSQNATETNETKPLELDDVTALVVTSRLSASERKSVGYCDLYSWAVVGRCLPYIGRCMHAYPVWPVLEKRSAATECMTDFFMRIDGLSSCEKADQRDFGEFRCRSTALFEL